MSTGEVRRVSHEDIQRVQNLIEQCLQLYMNEKEVVNTLLVQKKIEPCFTELVWQKLEEENREFFKAYHLRLIVKDQITLFNRLIESQVNAMYHTCQAGVASTSISNGSHIPPSPQNSSVYTVDPIVHGLKSDNMWQTMGSSLANTFCTGVSSSLHPCMENVIDMSSDARGPSMMLSQSTNHVLDCCGGSSPYMFGNVLESPHVIVDPVFSSVGFNSYPPSESLLDGYGLSFEFLPQITQIFSVSDSAMDILDHSTSPFLAEDNLYPHGSGGDNKRLRWDTLSESFSYEDFGTD